MSPEDDYGQSGMAIPHLHKPCCLHLLEKIIFQEFQCWLVSYFPYQTLQAQTWQTHFDSPFLLYFLNSLTFLMKPPLATLFNNATCFATSTQNFLFYHLLFLFSTAFMAF